MLRRFAGNHRKRSSAYAFVAMGTNSKELGASWPAGFRYNLSRMNGRNASTNPDAPSAYMAHLKPGSILGN